MIIYSIYKFVNKKNGKIYIGFTNNFSLRKINHKNAAKNPNSIFYKAMRKHGFENFDFEVIYQSKEKEHTKKIMEQHFIDEYNSMIPHGYNTCRGGGGGFVSPKTIERMKNNNPMTVMRTNSSSFKKGHKTIRYSDTSEKQRITKLGNLNPNYGKNGCWNHINKNKFKCLYCDVVTTIGNINRWHNDKCKKHI